MPTPNTYDRSNFKSILKNSPNLFHQTSLTTLPHILRSGAIIASGTLWGQNPASANQYYLNNPQRLSNLKHSADCGFVDYVFCSFNNGIQSGLSRYGFVSIEIDKKILLQREAFIYPFNFIFSWNIARAADKFSDLTTWNMAVTLRNRINTEILIRRQVRLDPNLIKFHCFQSVRQRVVDLLRELGYEGYEVIAHDDPQGQARFTMNALERTVQIGEQQFRGILSDDGRSVSVFNIIDNNDLDFLGKFQIDGNDNLIEHFPMTGRTEIVGRLLNTNVNAVNN